MAMWWPISEYIDKEERQKQERINNVLEKIKNNKRDFTIKEIKDLFSFFQCDYNDDKNLTNPNYYCLNKDFLLKHNFAISVPCSDFLPVECAGVHYNRAFQVILQNEKNPKKLDVIAQIFNKYYDYVSPIYIGRKNKLISTGGLTYKKMHPELHKAFLDLANNYLLKTKNNAEILDQVAILKEKDEKIL